MTRNGRFYAQAPLATGEEIAGFSLGVYPVERSKKVENYPVPPRSTPVGRHIPTRQETES